MKQLKITYNNNFFKTIIVIIIMLVSDDTLLFGTNINTNFVIMKYIVLILLFIILSLKSLLQNKKLCLYSSDIVCLILCSLVLLSGFINGDLRSGYFYKCLIITLSYLVVKTMSFEEFAKKFEQLFFVLALISTICTIIAEVRLSIFSIFPVFYNSVNTSFYNLGVYLVPTSISLLRNYGVFREPGVYQMFLVMALLFHLYYDDLKVSHVLVYIIAIVLTFSTTGYLALVVLLILFFIKKSNFLKENRKKILIFFLITIGIIYLFTQTDLLSSSGMIFDKFSNTKRTTTIARTSSIFVNLKIWEKNPLFGAGLVGIDRMFPQLTYLLYGKAITHNTNTLLCELATYGVFYTFILVNGYIKLSNLFTNNKIERILILLIIFILSCGEKLTFSPIIYILLFYGILFNKIKCKTQNYDKQVISKKMEVEI